MRENIGLYRGKRIDNDKWLYGSLLKVTIDGETAWLIFGNAFEFSNWGVRSLSHAQVDPNTVGECSGILDRANVFIFEGDILKITYLCQKPVTAVVEFANGKFTARYTRNGKEHIDNLTAIASSLYKVIGNIHDNPELLEQKSRDSFGSPCV